MLRCIFRWCYSMVAIALAIGGAVAAAASAESQPQGRAEGFCPPLLNHELRPLGGAQPRSLCEHAGKVILVVNTASFCGFTPQYEGLEALHRRYRERGFVVLGFPSNDFAQEPGSEAEIADFCRLTYSVGFPMYQKVTVRGQAQAHPFYRALAAKGGSFPRWNFHKYLIDRQGQAVVSFPTQVRPDDPALTRAIEERLAQP